MKAILVLEDSDIRISWLLDLVQDKYVKVVWAQTVRQFKEEFVREEDDIALVILDHDLGPLSLSSSDKNGQTGEDAAKLLPDQFKHPVVVWSTNTVGSRNIMDILKDKEIEAVSVPFLHDLFWMLSNVILEALEKRRT